MVTGDLKIGKDGNFAADLGDALRLANDLKIALNTHIHSTFDASLDYGSPPWKLLTRTVRKSKHSPWQRRVQRITSEE